jgi:hypothetical protein
VPVHDRAMVSAAVVLIGMNVFRGQQGKSADADDCGERREKSCGPQRKHP